MNQDNEHDMQDHLRITIDFNHMMSDRIGSKHGITIDEINDLAETSKEIHSDLKDRREEGDLPFFDLPYNRKSIAEINEICYTIPKDFDNFVVLGIGGSALGGIAIQEALTNPFYNMLTKKERKGNPRVFFADNIDPDGFQRLLDFVDLKKTAFNVISKSGETAETMAQFLIVKEKLTRVLGKDAYKRHIIITTDSKKGWLREIVNREGFVSLTVPQGVGGRFSVLSEVGLLPAAVMGISIEELLAGANYMNRLCRSDCLWENPAYMMAVLHYIACTKKGKTISIVMPYVDALKGLADWYCQLWAESLGKKFSLDNVVINAGQTPVKALGATDQHSQLQLYIEGPFDKVIAFIVVENYEKEVFIPPAYNDLEGVTYLGGHSLNELIKAEKVATELALQKNQRPNLTITLPILNAFTLGQLFLLFELQTVFSGALYHIDPLNQPGVEQGKQFTYGLMGRKGFEAKRKDVQDSTRKNKKYII
ncbi:MAG: glucose-6-phosphate isomerase [Thermodesulfobacteriota bacterium]|nr:glucose-6-phosphate isomerase [Thermodesulfobacteriota bacterium]